jgi:DNA repair protein RadD
MSTLTLRPYQELGADHIRRAFGSGKRAPLYVAPTGSGKTALFSAVAHGAAEKGNQVLILSHRVELVDQISGALERSETEHGFIAAGYPTERRQCMIASVQTLARRLDKVDEPQLIIIDEAHHARAATWEAVLAQWPRAKRIGFTATPIRQSGEGLASIFDCMILGPTIAELTPQYLAPARVFAPPTIDVSGLHTIAGEYITKETEARANKPSVIGDALVHYRRHVDGLPALVFCVSVKHAEDVAAQFRDAGYTAVTLKGGMDRQLRRDALRDFRAGRIQVITSCDLFSEGIDCPGVHAGIFLRPTQSLGLFRQQVGRILRPCEGKSHAWIFDHAQNTQKFGLPTDEPAWALTYDETKKKRNASMSCRVCAKCFAASSARAIWCSNCGEAFPVQPRSQVEQREGELVEVLSPEQIAKRQERIGQGMTKGLADLIEFGRKRGRSPGWAMHVWEARERKKAEKARARAEQLRLAGMAHE